MLHLGLAQPLVGVAQKWPHMRRAMHHVHTTKESTVFVAETMGAGPPAGWPPMQLAGHAQGKCPPHNHT